MNLTERLLDRAEKFIPLYKALIAGKTIQLTCDNGLSWRDLDSKCVGWQGQFEQYRIKPDPVVRAYKNLDEGRVAFNRIVYHNNVQFIILGGNDTNFYYSIFYNDGAIGRISECCMSNFVVYKFRDNDQPVGVLE